MGWKKVLLWCLRARYVFEIFDLEATLVADCSEVFGEKSSGSVVRSTLMWTPRPLDEDVPGGTFSAAIWGDVLRMQAVQLDD